MDESHQLLTVSVPASRCADVPAGPQTSSSGFPIFWVGADLLKLVSWYNDPYAIVIRTFLIVDDQKNVANTQLPLAEHFWNKVP